MWKDPYQGFYENLNTAKNLLITLSNNGIYYHTHNIWNLKMTDHKKTVIKEFLKICDWLLQTYQLRVYLFDKNPDLELLKSPMHGDFFYRIQEITQESWLHQLAKLHDPAVQNFNENLSINYIINLGDWSKNISEMLRRHEQTMLVLSEPIKKARNKLLSHNDLKAI